MPDEKTRQVELTEDGHEKIEQLLAGEGLLGPEDSLYQAANLGLLHHVHNALRAATCSAATSNTSCATARWC